MRADWPPDPALRGVEPPDTVPGLRDAGLWIGILGTFTVNGRPAAPQPAHAQLLLALALSPDGLDNDRLRYLLGDDPDHPVTGDALRRQITRARQRLGTAPDGGEWIEHLGAGHYMLHPGARLDWADFTFLSERGADAGDRAALRGALALIRGRPLAGCDLWWLDPVLAETVRAQVVAAADTLAGLDLAAGDPPASARAAYAGLRADPAAEPLWRAVMRAEHAAGNLAGVHTAYAACSAAIRDAGAPGLPHLDTVRLHRQLAAAGSGATTPDERPCADGKSGPASSPLSPIQAESGAPAGVTGRSPA